MRTKTIDELEQPDKAGKLRTIPRMEERVVEPALFGAAVQYFTGKKDHNEKLREKTVTKVLKINEYGLCHVEDDRRIAGRTEEAVYAALRLPWIPPEIREDQGEIELA